MSNCCLTLCISGLRDAAILKRKWDFFFLGFLKDSETFGNRLWGSVSYNDAPVHEGLA